MNTVKLLTPTFYGVKFRSRHRRCSVRKSVLRNFSKFTGKHLCQSLYFNKVAGLRESITSIEIYCLRPATLLKQRLWRRSFDVNFAKFLRILFFQNTSGRMLLQIVLGQESFRDNDMFSFYGFLIFFSEFNPSTSKKLELTHFCQYYLLFYFITFHNSTANATKQRKALR